METNANHLIVGFLTITAVVLAFMVVVVLGRFGGTYDSFYVVKFFDSVTGLSVGGEVRYNGVKVGEVNNISFDPAEPSAVLVTVRIKERHDFALQTDSQVSLELLGITGLTYVHIEGGAPGGELLPQVHDPDGRLPLITATPSAIQQLYEGVPSILEQTKQITDQLAAILSDENQEKISSILHNLDQVSGSFADKSGDVEEIITSMAGLSQRFESIAGNIDTLVTDDVTDLIIELNTLTTSVDGIVGLTEEVINENRSNITEFSSQGLPQLALFVQEARQLVSTMDRIARRLERDPAGFLLQSQGAEYEAVP